MPQFTIDIPQKAVDRLHLIVARYNHETGDNLTLAQWLDLHVRELSIAEELAASAAALQKQVEDQARDDVTAAVRAERERLLDALDSTITPPP